MSHSIPHPAQGSSTNSSCTQPLLFSLLCIFASNHVQQESNQVLQEQFPCSVTPAPHPDPHTKTKEEPKPAHNQHPSAEPATATPAQERPSNPRDKLSNHSSAPPAHSLLASLPCETITRVMACVSAKDLGVCSQTCALLRQLSGQEVLWRRLCLER